MLPSSSFLWQPMQVRGASLYSAPFLWQSMHLVSTCLPFNAKRVLSWSSLASFQSFSVWQSAHLAPRDPLCTSSLRWQASQSDDACEYFFFGSWHFSHSTLACLPRRT